MHARCVYVCLLNFTKPTAENYKLNPATRGLSHPIKHRGKKSRPNFRSVAVFIFERGYQWAK